jgi:hypothetical protein
VIVLIVTRVAPVFASQKAYVKDKYLTETPSAKKKPAAPFKNLLDKELQRQAKIDMKV